MLKINGEPDNERRQQWHGNGAASLFNISQRFSLRSIARFNDWALERGVVEAFVFGDNLNLSRNNFPPSCRWFHGDVPDCLAAQKRSG